MTPVEALRIALRVIRRHALRSGLTMLGVLIGVAAVIVLVAVGNGARLQVARSIQGLGTNLLIVFPGSASSGGIRLGLGSANTLTVANAQALRPGPLDPDVRAVSPEVSGTVTATAGSRNWTTTLQGGWPPLASMRDYHLAAGRMFTWAEVNGAARVAVLGQTVAQNLFGSVTPVGQPISIDGTPFTVVGVFAPKGAAGRVNEDDLVEVPLTAAQDYVLGHSGHVQNIYVQATSAGSIPYAESEVGAILLDQHHLSSPAQADFQILTQQNVLNAATSVTGTLTLLLGAVAAISLLVGGIGVMNIMLVTVTERTREIGIRRAVGARRSDLLAQFLIEATVLSVLGGAAGILTGYLASMALGRIAGRIAPAVSGSSVLLAAVVSVGVGLVFGFYPAARAARLTPMDALRRE